MTDATQTAVNSAHKGSTTPTGVQSTIELARRRISVLVLNVVTYFAMLWWMASILGNGGWTIIDIVMMGCFIIGLPWTVLGFWNAVIGLWLLHGVADATARVAPFAAAGDVDVPITVRTAILMTLRNEDPARAFKRLSVVKASLDATGHGRAFDYFILSDTNKIDVADAEAHMAEAFAVDAGIDRVVYRRRTDNTGFKAGNVRDFCERWGLRYELMLPLDADSLMSGQAIVRLARMMQAHPKLGILQSLVVGMPSQSAFARIFQFGMRHGMRPYTMGQAWWVGDCGPFWGHNALVRIKPFVEDCDLPMLPGAPPLGGHVLSHDQVEATLMRRAGYEVRVLPDERGSWEENPPTLFEFSQRDVRWCQGNLQYLKLLDLKGLKPISRFQLVWAILMFLGVPAFTIMIVLAPLKALEADAASFPALSAILLYLTFQLMYLSPKVAGFLDILLKGGEAQRYGGRAKFVAGVATELMFSFLLGAVTTFRIAVFMVGLVFGKSVVWSGQARDAHGIGWGEATAQLWPVTLFGLVVCTALWFLAPTALWWGLPMLAAYLTAIPFTVITSWPETGARMAKARLCAIPEEYDTPAEIASVQGGVAS
jgi:membrane glycosyltransferase